MNNYFTDELIIAQLCQQRIRLAEQRDRKHYLPRLIGGRHREVDNSELSGLLPSRRTWNAFRPRHPREGADIDLLALRRAVTVLREQDPDLSWVGNLNRFIQAIRGRIDGQHPFAFTKPRIAWLPKSGNLHEFRALAIFPLQDNIIACLFANYLRHRFDANFSPSSYAFRDRNSEGQTPTHHDAFNRLFELKNSMRQKDLYVAECDIRGFYDTLDHSVALAAFERGAEQSPVDPRAFAMFRAYLDCYNFQDNVLADAEPRLKQDKGEAAHFPWPRSAMAGVERRIVGIPQGGAISGVIANLVLDVADKAVEQARRHLGADVHYYRFCDDMILLSPSQQHCQQVFATYLQTLDQLKLPYHQPKATWIYGRNHWGRKSKSVYCWSGRKWFGCVPWVQFVGYQLRYDGLVRPRKDAFHSQAKQFVETTDEVKHGLLRAGRHRKIKASRLLLLRSFAGKLTTKGIGRLMPYTSGPRPMCWSSGFKALHQKPIVGSFLRRLDRLRQRQINRFASADINSRNSGQNHSSQAWNPTGYANSYTAQFRNDGGQQLIDNPWRPQTRREEWMSKVFIVSVSIRDFPHRFGRNYRKLKKRVRNLLASHTPIKAREIWRDARFAGNRLYEVEKVGWYVRCHDLALGRIRCIPRVLFDRGCFVRQADEHRNLHITCKNPDPFAVV